MRFVSFEKNGKAGLAVEATDGKLRGLAADDANWPSDLDDLLRSGGFDEAAEALAAGSEIDPETVRIALPFRRAGKVLCVGLNYADHAKESKMEAPSFPTVFVRFNSNLIPHGAKLIRPDASDQFDYEGEMVAVIGKPGRDIGLDAALDHEAFAPVDDLLADAHGRRNVANVEVGENEGVQQIDRASPMLRIVVQGNPAVLRGVFAGFFRDDVILGCLHAGERTPVILAELDIGNDLGDRRHRIPLLEIDIAIVKIDVGKDACGVGAAPVRCGYIDAFLLRCAHRQSNRRDRVDRERRIAEFELGGIGRLNG